ncbi:Zn-ribbon domain-containing OB-fold protein [Microvirga splendida]|uniref:OB-fold domain-containing protein n=1 Tax=Microvirga splendida TaxID=2795727 RepID=A0ABS0Y861_9HYPH|nr:OB-fold domain-containing protein [Microvirga splendida]MBJ6128105.1 OB-fold domain-containing protein [Microvirga splendida]
MSPDPRFDGPGPEEVWLTALKEGRFLLQHCRTCHACRFPPALVCGACGSSEIEWKEASGRGTIYSTTTVRERDNNYNVSLVDLAEGARMMSRVDGVSPDEVRIGMEVQARIVAEPEPIVLFAPSAGGAS